MLLLWWNFYFSYSRFWKQTKKVNHWQKAVLKKTEEVTFLHCDETRFCGWWKGTMSSTQFCCRRAHQGKNYPRSWWSTTRNRWRSWRNRTRTENKNQVCFLYLWSKPVSNSIDVLFVQKLSNFCGDFVMFSYGFLYRKCLRLQLSNENLYNNKETRLYASFCSGLIQVWFILCQSWSALCQFWLTFCHFWSALGHF